jgi:arabinofuranosyltransferase
VSADGAAAPHPLLRTRVLLLAWLVLLALQLWGYAGVRHDDAYITYRYGQNLASGAGLVFNPGERLLGSTSPGQMLLAAGVYALAGISATPAVLAAIGCMAWGAQSIALFLLLSAALGRAGAALVAASVALGSTHAQNWVPLETNLVAACVLFAFAAAQHARWYAVALWLATAVLFRPDAWLAAIVLGGACVWQRRREALGPCLVFALAAAPWPLFASAYYGSPLPQSALTKYQRSGLLEYLMHELVHPAELLMPPMPQALAAALTWALALLGAALLLRRAPRLAPFVIYAVLHALAYLWLRPFTIHTWHMYPWVLALCVLCWSGLICLGQRLRARRAAWLATGCAALGLLVTHAAGFIGGLRTLEHSYWMGQRQAVYEDIAGYLRQHAAPGEAFASVEVGTIAYYTDLPAFDLGGLVTRPSDQMAEHPVRFLVLDRQYMRADVRAPPVYRSQHGDFLAVVYRTGQ